MANGFQTSSPASRHGSLLAGSEANSTRIQKFTMPGTNGVSYELTEIGFWISADNATTGKIHLGVFDHDAVNDCPSTIVANSDSGEITISDTSVLKRSVAYAGTKPQVVGGSIYWIGGMIDSVNLNLDYAAGGTAIRITTGLTYPTWPTDTAWHTHTDQTNDYGVYVVYQAGATAVTGPFPTFRPDLP